MTYPIRFPAHDFNGRIILERVEPTGRELTRELVHQDGTYIGDVIHVTRSPRGYSSVVYGWRPDELPANVALTDKHDAIKRLPRFNDWTKE